MYNTCAQFCPIADLCTQRHETLTELQRENIRAFESTQSDYALLQKEQSESATEASFAEISLHLIHEGIALSSDRPSETDHALEKLHDNRQNNAKHELSLEFLQKMLAYYAKVNADNLANLHVTGQAIEKVDTAQQSCHGPVLTARGKYRWARAVVISYMRPNEPTPAEANKRYLMRNGYAKCINPLAKIALGLVKKTDRPSAAN